MATNPQYVRLSMYNALLNQYNSFVSKCARLEKEIQELKRNQTIERYEQLLSAYKTAWIVLSNTENEIGALNLKYKQLYEIYLGAIRRNTELEREIKILLQEAHEIKKENETLKEIVSTQYEIIAISDKQTMNLQAKLKERKNEI